MHFGHDDVIEFCVLGVQDGAVRKQEASGLSNAATSELVYTTDVNKNRGQQFLVSS